MNKALLGASVLLCVLLAACHPRPSDSAVEAAVKDYYGERELGSDKPYTVPAAQLQVFIVSIGEPNEDVFEMAGMWHHIWQYPATVHIRGNCRPHRDWEYPDKPRQATYLDEQQTLVMLKNDDGTFEISEIDGHDAQASIGSPWVCD